VGVVHDIHSCTRWIEVEGGEKIGRDVVRIEGEGLWSMKYKI
jgi:hypothetical protein